MGPRRARLLRIGAPDSFLHDTGEQEYARRVVGLTGDAIATRICERLVGRVSRAA
jgi:hypothetical protein